MKVYHFIGIGGVSMSGLAKILYSQGNTITGSDINPQIKLDFATIFHNHHTQNVKVADVVVYNNAISKNNPEIIEAKRLNKKIISRAELLAKISKEYKNVIAVSGTHGKTTTTEMIAETFLLAGKNPTVHIGAISNAFKSNTLIGKKDYFITEACEYGNSFLTLSPTLSVILNIEKEHLDFFKNFENIKYSYTKFFNQSKNVIIHNNYKNLIIKNKQIKNNSKEIKKSRKNRKINVFCGNYLIYAKNIRKNKNKLIYDLYYKNKFKTKVVLNSIIEKNIENSLACYLVCKHFHIDERYFLKAMKKFKGTERRMEILKNSPFVIEDYAHHPTEIKTVVESVQKELDTNKKLYVIFQPHTYTRTKDFFKDFVRVLCTADFVGILETFSARENIIQGATGFDLYKAIKTKFQNFNKQAFYFQNIYEVKKFIMSISKDSVVLYLGAGNSLKTILT